MPAEPEASRAKKSRRFTAPPQQVSSSHLVGVFELAHGAKQTGPGASAPTEAPSGTKPGGSKKPENDEGTGIAGASPQKEPSGGKTDPILEQRADDDDPRRWGDRDEDLGDWLKSQRPPHWD